MSDATESRERLSDAERTDLAWNRSGLALLGCGAAVAKGLARSGVPPRNVAVGVTILFFGALIWALGAWHAERVTRAAARPTRFDDLLPVVCGVVLVGVGAFVLGMLFPD